MKTAGKRPNRLSEEGRRACSAAGLANIAGARSAYREAASVLRSEVFAVEAAIRAQIGHEPLTGAEMILLRTVLASYEAVYTVQRGLLSARNSRRVETLISQLTPAAGTLLRSLRALGLSPQDAGDASEPPGADLEAVEREIHEARQ